MMNRLKAVALAATLWMLPAAALAQSNPGWPFGYVPTVAEWNAAFSAKADYTGSSPITAAGGTFTGKVNFASSGAGTAGMNCGVGTAPSSPINGDIWCTTAGMFVQINGSTVGPLGTGAGGTLAVTGGGTGVATIPTGQVMIGQGTGAITTYARAGTATTIATASGALTSGHCVSINGTGDFVDAGGACTTGGGGGTVASSTIGQIAVYTGATTVTGIAACTNGYYGTNAVGAGAVSCLQTLNTTLSSTITVLGVIGTGGWQGTPIAGQYGGTGVANTGLTITLAGNLVTSGANSLTLTTIGPTNVTLPTTGTLMHQNGTSGGIPYYNSATTVQSSAALTANLPLFGGGAAASPFSGTRTGSTTEVATYTGSAPTSTHCAQWDASGNLTDSGATCAGASGGAVLLTTINCASVSGCTDINGTCPSASSTTGCFTNTYSRYEIDLENLVVTTTSTAIGCQIHVYNTGGTYQTSGYLSNYSGSLSSTNITQYIACWPSNTGLANNLVAPGASGSFIVYNPSASAKAQIRGNVNVPAASTSNNLLSGGWWNTNSAIVGFRVCAATSPGTCGSTWASGTIKVYGLP